MTTTTQVTPCEARLYVTRDRRGVHVVYDRLNSFNGLDDDQVVIAHRVAVHAMRRARAIGLRRQIIACGGRIYTCTAGPRKDESALIAAFLGIENREYAAAEKYLAIPIKETP